MTARFANDIFVDPDATTINLFNAKHGEALPRTLNAKAGMQEVLETLGRRQAVSRSLVVLMDEEGGQLQVEAAHGLNRPSHHIHYTLGEGVIGKVVESGRAVVVRRVTKEPTLVFPTAGRIRRARK
jgi:Nif-specific regulatory protein